MRRAFISLDATESSSEFMTLLRTVLHKGQNSSCFVLFLAQTNQILASHEPLPVTLMYGCRMAPLEIALSLSSDASSESSQKPVCVLFKLNGEQTALAAVR